MDSRITKIYADLVSLEKMMHYKRSILDVMKDVQPGLDTDEGRRLTLVEECHDRWVENARTLRSGNSRNSRKEEECHDRWVENARTSRSGRKEVRP